MRYQRAKSILTLSLLGAGLAATSGCDECIDGATRACACPTGNGVLRCGDGEWLACECFGVVTRPPPPPPPPSSCGDGICDFSESPRSCPRDCACGDGVCTATDRTACPGDCSPECLRRECGPFDDPRTCPDACREEICGDGVCWPPEVEEITCPFDCDLDAGICDLDGGCDGGASCDLDGGCDGGASCDLDGGCDGGASCDLDGGCDGGVAVCVEDGGCDAGADAG